MIPTPPDWSVAHQMHDRHLPAHCAYSIALNGFEPRKFLLYRGVLRHIKRHEAAACRVIGAGIPAGNIRDHLEERRPITWEEPQYAIITLSKISSALISNDTVTGR